MKKVLSIILVAIMLSSMLILPTNAKEKEPFGTIVEIPKADAVPHMTYANVDETWGEPLIHIDGTSENAGITQYKRSGNVKQDLSFDLYGRWTDNIIYLCFVSPDPDFRGQKQFWWGDGVQMVIYPGIIDISYCNNVSTGWVSKEEFEAWDWCITLYTDDHTSNCSDVAEGKSVLWTDAKNKSIVVKFAIDAQSLGYRKNETLKENDLFSFSMNRIDGSDEDPHEEAYVGWLEWGDFFNKEKGWGGDESLYVPTAENERTTSANTFKLVATLSEPEMEEPEEEPIEEVSEEPAEEPTPIVLKGEPSSWAKDEVLKALDAGLIPEELTDGFTNGISRANLSKILAKLLDKVYGKDAEKAEASFTDTTDADVLKAANLGIINGYKQNDGTYMFKPENTLKRSEMSAIINRVAKLCGKTTDGFDGEVKFADTASHWCNGELGWPVHNGIVKGTSATTFSPENTLTVEQTIMMIYRTYEALK